MTSVDLTKCGHCHSNPCYSGTKNI